jgi:renalase
MKKIAIIGAGLSGLVLGKYLSKKADVSIFEKARGVGGRMSTRYVDSFIFDHGAQCWTAKTKLFQHFLAPLMDSVVAGWKGSIITLEKGSLAIKNISESNYLVATPHMNSLCKHLALDLNIETQCEVTNIKSNKDNKWHVMSRSDRDLGVYDVVISTAPAPQTLNLFSHYIPEDHIIRKAKFDSCFCLMIGINKPWDRDWIAADVRHSPIQWISVNSTKPGRRHDVTCLVVHSEAAWTEANLYRDIQEVEAFLLKELSALITLDITNISYISTHRWLYSRLKSFCNSTAYIDFNLGLCATGDWCVTSNIEDIWCNAEKIGGFLVSKI